MATAFGGILASIGLALVITALAMPGRQTPQIIDESAKGLSRLMSASLGYGAGAGV